MLFRSFLNPANFKSYDDLKAKLTKVLSSDNPIDAIKKAEDSDVPWAREEEAPKQKAKAAPSFESAKVGGMTSDDEDDDESLEYFKKLANE